MAVRGGGVLVVWIALLLAAAAAAAQAADPLPESTPAVEATKPLSPQQQRMKDCAALAREKALRGAARRAFFSTCLSGGEVLVEFGSAGGVGQPSVPAEAMTEHAEPAAVSSPAPQPPDVSPPPHAEPLAKKPASGEAGRLAFKKRLGECLAQLRQEPKTGAARKAFMQQCLAQAPITDSP